MFIYVTLFSMGAAITDLWRGKIYNKYLFCTAGAGLVLRMILEGPTVIRGGILLAGTVFCILIPLYLLRAVGGGDVKMLSVTALLVSRKELMLICFFAVVITLTVGIMRMIRRRMQRKNELTTVAFAVPFFYSTVFSILSRQIL